MPEAGETDLYGKTANELQTGVSIDGTDITGTLHYVTDYVGFNGSDPTEQEGNFLALNITANTGVTRKVELVNGKNGAVTMDPEDPHMVLLITNKDTQKVKITVSKDSDSEVKTYDLTGLTLEEGM